MISNNRNINKAIKAETGYDINVHKAEGCVSFYSDDNTTGLMLARFDETTVYVNTIYSLSVEEWVERFQYILEKNKDEIERHKEIMASGAYNSKDNKVIKLRFR